MTNEGKLNLTWVSNPELGQRCLGCTDPFYIGELTLVLNFSGTKLRFHEECINQVVMSIVAFVETTNDIREGVSGRHN